MRGKPVVPLRLLVPVADGETGPTAASADIAIEKSVLETPISAVIRIRDVKLEVLETP